MSQTSTLHSSDTPMMASSEVPNGRTTIGAGGLYTPQEPTLDSFSQPQEEKRDDATSLPPVQTVQTHSPPASPEFRPINLTEQEHDRQLFDEPEQESEESQPPLFDEDGDVPVVDAAPAEPPRPAKKAKSPSTEELLKGVTNLGTIIGPHVFIHPSLEGAYDYWKARMAEVYRIRAAQAQLPKPSRSPAAVPRDPETARQLRLVDQSAKITKNKSPPKAAARPRTATKASPSKAATPEQTEPKPVSRRSRTPKVRAHDDLFDDDGEKKHKRAAPSKQTATKEHDVAWRDLPNFAPPLPEDETSYGVVWKQSSRLDNSAEVDFDELSPAEKEACAILRLPPVRWLANKRRIFAAKLEAVRKGEKFTKTKAQVASNIDVNKATQLFEAFERMGWMENAWFEQFQ